MSFKKLSKAEEFYISQNRGKMEPKQICKDLGITIKRYEAYVGQLPPPEPIVEAPPPKKTCLENGGFKSEVPGVVAMTQLASEKGDKQPPPTNEKFYETVRDNIHKIDPDLPIN